MTKSDQIRQHPDLGKVPDLWIARHLGVTRCLVSAVRSKMGVTASLRAQGCKTLTVSLTQEHRDFLETIDPSATIAMRKLLDSAIRGKKAREAKQGVK